MAKCISTVHTLLQIPTTCKLMRRGAPYGINEKEKISGEFLHVKVLSLVIHNISNKYVVR